MSKTWLASDHHLGHRNIITFLDNSGKNIRPFSSIEEHDETIIENHNKLVKPEDRVYFMGDVVMKRKDLHLIGRMNGRKKLIKGNHDIFGLKDYMPYFEDILACRMYPVQSIAVTHIPIHEQQLTRFKWNVHGHLHQNSVMMNTYKHKPDERYINLSLEHTDFKPVEFDDLLVRIGWDKNASQTTKRRDAVVPDKVTDR